MQWQTFEAKIARGAVMFHLNWRHDWNGPVKQKEFMERPELDCYMIANGNWRVDWTGTHILAEDPDMGKALDKAYDAFQSMWLMNSFDKTLSEMAIFKGKCNCGPDCDWEAK